MKLLDLVTEAQALAGERQCAVLGHDWVTIGGRACPHACPEGYRRSQPVYHCRRCGEYDYGHPGGPGYEDCVRYCGLIEVAA